MISMQNHDVGSTSIDIMNVTKIIATKPFQTDTPETCYREIRFVDDRFRSIIINLYAPDMKALEITEVER